MKADRFDFGVGFRRSRGVRAGRVGWTLRRFFVSRGFDVKCNRWVRIAAAELRLASVAAAD